MRNLSLLTDTQLLQFASDIVYHGITSTYRRKFIAEKLRKEAAHRRIAAEYYSVVESVIKFQLIPLDNCHVEHIDDNTMLLRYNQDDSGEPIYEDTLETTQRRMIEEIQNQHFLFYNVIGESMIEVGILPNDTIAFLPTKKVKNFDIVLAMLNGSAYVKRFIQQGSDVILRSENKNIRDYVVRDVDSLVIQGVVKKVIKNL